MAGKIIKPLNRSWAIFVLDGLLLFISFCVAYYAKRGHLFFYTETVYIKALPMFTLSWVVSHIVTNKLANNGNEPFLLRPKAYIVSVFVFVGTMSLYLYALKLYDLSRLIVFGTICIYFMLEVFLFSGIYFKIRHLKKKDIFSLIFFLLEFLIITGSFYAFYFFKRDSFALTKEYKIVLLLVYVSWCCIGLLVHNFHIPQERNYLKVIWPFLKSFFILISIISFFVFGVRIIEFSRLIIFGSLTVFALSEFFIVSGYYFLTEPSETDEPEITLFKTAILNEQLMLERIVKENKPEFKKHRLVEIVEHSISIRQKLENIYLKKFPELFQFIDRSLDLSTADIISSEVINSANLYNVEILPDDSFDLFINLHELNDFRRINQYLIEVNRILKQGGVFISRFEPKQKRRIHFLQKYPYYLANTLYFLDFIWKRCFPKLPFLQKVYFAATKGVNRVLSISEGLGRLYFCGFEVIDLTEIDSFLYFIVKKVEKPLDDVKPSYSPIFAMKRIGKHGKPIYIYKFRTMYPYSEFLQDYVVQRFGYGSKGKVRDDFRVTSWGKFLRRFWLDELPQLINFFKGDLALVGVRPVSERFLSEYPHDLKEIRLQHKPGCFPPYVAYRKQKIEEYIESERKYFLEKMRHPFLTDIKILFLVVYNIVTNKVRSE